MSYKITITVKEKHSFEVKRIKAKCEENNVSFSALCVDGLIKEWRKLSFEDKELRGYRK